MSDEIQQIPNTNTSDPTTTSSSSSNDNRRPSAVEAEAALAASQHRGSLGATPNPMSKDSVTESGDGIPPTSSVGQHNAPGKLGQIGEKVLGGFGYGGATVERPKEEQGLGEKIVNFLGA